MASAGARVIGGSKVLSRSIRDASRTSSALARLAAIGHIAAMLHLSKLCVGIRDVGQLRDWQARRTENHPPLRHKTRNAPRRVAEIVEGGSIYWVIAGVMLVRQRILAIRPDTWDDGSACAALLLHPDLVAVEARAVRAFQGWRYLTATDAPADLDAGDRPAEHGLPDGLRADLRRLALL